CMPALDFPLTF
nr:immunoglobulin light chain junction region [Macaca mulatta]